MRQVFTQVIGRFEIASDGVTVWVNGSDGANVARFSRSRMDIHRNDQTGAHCLDCKAGPTNSGDWVRFRDGIRRLCGVEIADQHAPEFIEGDGMPLKMEDIKAGDKLIGDGGFTCIEEGRVCEVKADAEGCLYVNCCGSDIDLRDDNFDPALLTYAESHGLDGQEDEDGIIVGFEKAPA